MASEGKNSGESYSNNLKFVERNSTLAVVSSESGCQVILYQNGPEDLPPGGFLTWMEFFLPLASSSTSAIPKK